MEMEYAVINENAAAEIDEKKHTPQTEYTESEMFNFEQKPIYDFFKRVFDILVSVVFLIVLSPFFIIISIMILIDDHTGSPIFMQKRCGKDGKVFKLYKFRTMCPDAEKKLDSLKEKNEMDGPVFKIKDDPRITKLGRFLRATSIDEFPQLLNILKGDMSFVGPRPALPKEVEQYDAIHRVRLMVKPGLTCYWQIEPERNSILFEDWMSLDRKYIAERSLFVDIKVILKTFVAVFRREGC